MKPEQTRLAQFSKTQIVGDDNTAAYVRRKLLVWGRGHFENFPWRSSTNEFYTLISEILLQRTKAPQVIPTYLNFIKKYPNPKRLASAAIQEIETTIQPLGLRWRAKLLFQLGNALKEFNWKVPADEQALLQLPGIGPYVSAAYLSLHRRKRAPIVDSNIVRFYGRFFGFDTGPETRRNQAVLRLANLITPERKFKEFNYSVIDFTRLVCQPKSCHYICPLSRKCVFYITCVKDKR